jgi:hypothetical protein
MGQQSVRQAARRVALDAQAVLRKERADRERRLQALAVAVLTALGERDALVRDAERRAAQALRTSMPRCWITWPTPRRWTSSTGTFSGSPAPGWASTSMRPQSGRPTVKAMPGVIQCGGTLMGAWQSGDDPRTGPGLSPIWRSRRPGSGIAADGPALSAMTPSATLSWRNTMPPSSTASSALKPLPSRFS